MSYLTKHINKFFEKDSFPYKNVRLISTLIPIKSDVCETSVNLHRSEPIIDTTKLSVYFCSELVTKKRAF